MTDKWDQDSYNAAYQKLHQEREELSWKVISSKHEADHARKRYLNLWRDVYKFVELSDEVPTAKSLKQTQELYRSICEKVGFIPHQRPDVFPNHTFGEST